MSTVFEQGDRLLNLETPLGKDVLLLDALNGQESLSQLFHFALDMISERNVIAPQEIVGKNVSFALRLLDGSVRHFNGYVKSFSAGGKTIGGLRQYHADVVPWLWFLTQTADCRIFQSKTVKQIIAEVFSDLGFHDFDDTGIKGQHLPHDYCVQYRETYFNFISRLMEEEGIFYYFRHEKGKHTLVLADQKGAYQDCLEKSIEFSAGVITPGHIDSWERKYQFHPGRWVQTDYNFETPSTQLLTDSSTIDKLPTIEKYEIFDYPGAYPKKADGELLTRLRMEADEVRFDTIKAGGSCRTFFAGGQFTLMAHDVVGDKGIYVITSINHMARNNGYQAGADTGGTYHNHFTCIPASVVFRPPRTSPRPVVHGAQTAVVVGPGGEEIYTDKYARVKVQFHWDRKGKKTEKSSCWVRVAQQWAGKQWGFQFIPRIGQEVVVDFLEGDPDQPIIVGSVYNAEQMPPYAVPANATQSGIKTRSSKGGGAANFNEIRFEDKMGSEELYIHAEKDNNIVVEHDRALLVGNDETQTVKRDKSETVERNKLIHVMGNHSENIDGAVSITIGKTKTESVLINSAETIAGAKELTVGAALAISVGAAMSETVAGAKAETIGIQKAETVGGNSSLTVGKNRSENISGELSVKVGKDVSKTIAGQQKINIAKDFILNAKKIQVVAEDEITFKCGDASILMKKNGDITIKGNKITIKGSGDVILKGSKISEN